MLCTFKWGIYIFFGFWQFVAIFFTYFLVPETRGVPIEEVDPQGCLQSTSLMLPAPLHLPSFVAYCLQCATNPPRILVLGVLF